MLRIGCGAGFSGDLLDPAVVLAEMGDLDYLVLECLAERTIALAQKRKLQDPADGYDPLLEERIRKLLPVVKRKGIRLITNMGAANPLAAAARVVEIARDMNTPVRVAAVTGDDVLHAIDLNELTLEDGRPLREYGRIISANAYLGADALIPALESDADVVITGRVADPSLFVAPVAFHYGWSLNDWDRIGRATVVGHLLECAGQVSGGYFGDPGKKDVPRLFDIGFPLAEVDEEGNAVITKVEGTGGLINIATVKEQLLYEVTDPTGYVTPDVIVDFRTIELDEVGQNRVLVKGAVGREKPPTLKVSVGYHAGYVGEGEIIYAGANALGRAKLAGEIVERRLVRYGLSELRIDYVGYMSAHRGSGVQEIEPYEVRLRVVGRAATKDAAIWVGREVEALYTNGPAGGGGVRKSVTEVVGIVSILIPRHTVEPEVSIREWP